MSRVVPIERHSQKGKKLERNSLRHIWTEKHWAEYQYDKDHNYWSISPHYARHWFMTWFRVYANTPELWVQHLQGDKTGKGIGPGRQAIHRYIHIYYENVEQEYRENVFNLEI